MLAASRKPKTGAKTPARMAGGLREGWLGSPAESDFGPVRLADIRHWLDQREAAQGPSFTEPVDFAGWGVTLLSAGERRQRFPTAFAAVPSGNAVSPDLRRSRCPNPNASIRAARH